MLGIQQHAGDCANEKACAISVNNILYVMILRLWRGVVGEL